jgi:hypothetical protein
MCSLWTTVVTTMLQRLKRLTCLLGLLLSRHQGMALLERVQASTLSDADRDRVPHIMRATLRLPEAPVPEPSAPEAPLLTRSTPQRTATRQRESVNASRHRQRPAS